MTSGQPRIDSPDTLPGWVFPGPRFEVDWSRSALLVIDLRNYGCNADVGLIPVLRERNPDVAAYYVERLMGTVIPAARRLVDAFRAAGRSCWAALSGFARVFGQVWDSGRVLAALTADGQATSSTSAPTSA